MATASKSTGTPPDHERSSLLVQRIQPAYHQVAEQLRSLIVEGVLAPGARLPVEADMSTQFGVSRSTIREALRVLSSQGLVYSVRGASGGTFVADADADAIRSYLETSIGLLSGNEGMSSAELLEARELLEVPATALAATRHTDADLAEMRAAIDADVAAIATGGRMGVNHRFHSALLDASGNRLVHIMTVPVFRVIQARFRQERQAESLWHQIDTDHEEILELVAAGRADEAGRAMQQHLERLRPAYTSIDS